MADHDLNQSKETSEANGGENKHNSQSVEEEGNVPKIGMTFNSMEEVHDFNKNYARATWFDIMQKRSTNDKENNILRYFAFACARSGKPNTPPKNSFRGRPSIKTDCKAKINATRTREGKFILSRVEFKHNHAISPSKVRFFRGNKHIDGHTRKRLELNDQAGIPMCKNFNLIVEEAGGYNNLPCGQKQCQNYIGKMRRLPLGEGDAEGVNNYFARMRKKNPQFYHSIDLGDEGHLRNVFWADARSRVAYESFDDAVCFDSTYMTNKYDMPFAPFVGVNHQSQSILLGCGLLSSETKENYVWLFKEWLGCMSASPPQAIITDQLHL